MVTDVGRDIDEKRLVGNKIGCVLLTAAYDLNLIKIGEVVTMSTDDENQILLLNLSDLNNPQHDQRIMTLAILQTYFRSCTSKRSNSNDYVRITVARAGYHSNGSMN